MNQDNLKYQHSDEALVFTIIHKEETHLFETLHQRYYSIVYGRCLSFFKNKQDAEDVSQEIFFKVFLKLDTFLFKSKFSTWLYSFTHNYCINYKRNIEFRKFKNKLIDSERLSEEFFSYNYDSCIIDEYQLIRLKLAISLLPKYEQKLVLLKYCGHMTIREMAEVYNLGESAIKMKLKRIKNKIIKNYRTADFEELKFA